MPQVETIEPGRTLIFSRKGESRENCVTCAGVQNGRFCVINTPFQDWVKDPCSPRLNVWLSSLSPIGWECPNAVTEADRLGFLPVLSSVFDVVALAPQHNQVFIRVDDGFVAYVIDDSEAPWARK